MTGAPPLTSMQEEAIQRLLHQIHILAPYTYHARPGGRNNRGFVLSSDEKQFWLKLYFRHPNDPRDRLANEYHYLSLLWHHGLRNIPQPLASDSATDMALFEFIEAKPIPLEEISEFEIESVCHFFTQSNTKKIHSAATHLQPASEACFTLDEHLQTAQRRLRRLDQMEPETAIDKLALAFIQSELLPLSQSIFETLQKHPLRQPIGRCLSPSDFGFHNALRRKDNTICFVDFEYAGWDDPAKTVCDFINQPDLPPPAHLSQQFLQTVLHHFQHDSELPERIRMLTPLYQMKWACIILNEFLPIGKNRREFRGSIAEDKKTLVLEKSRTMLSKASASLQLIL